MLSISIDGSKTTIPNESAIFPLGETLQIGIG